MRGQLMRTFSLHGLFALSISVSLFGCLTKVDSGAGSAGAACKADKNCRDGLTCIDNHCRAPGAVDAGSKNEAGAKPDGAQASSDSRGLDAGSKPDGVLVAPDSQDTATHTPEVTSVDPDAPVLQPDGPVQPDASAPEQPDAPTSQPDVQGSPDTRPTDTNKPDALPCNGGCCSNAECPLDKPVCNAANVCSACKADTDCTGRALLACNVSTGACVQCTQSKPCASPLTCDTVKNQCVGCTTRSDCSGACQTCSNGSCVPVKDADDPTKCAGTCDSTGQCKAKQGQKCNVVSDCLNNMACADGVCCNRACAGTCEACDLATAPGTCTVLTAGSAPHHGTCANTGSGVANTACGGSCQGKTDGTCSYASDTTACGTASCTSNGQAQAAGKCNGTGLCSMPGPVSCKTGGTCSTGTCSCPASLPNECPNACVDFKTDGKNCGACGHDCLGGACLKGICQPVVMAKPSGSYGVSIFGLDSQYVYYTTLVTQVNPETYRIGINAANGTGTLLRESASVFPLGVIANTVYFHGGRDTPKYCQASNCLSTIDDLPTAGNGELIPYGSPSPANYPMWQADPDSSSRLKITWYSTSNQPVTSWLDDTPPDDDGAFWGFGSTVYWLRNGATDRTLLAVDSANPVRKRLSGQISLQGGIADINAQSVLLLLNPGLYRVPLPLGMGNNPPALVLSGTSADVQFVTEDANYLYWADGAGAIYKCPSDDLAHCESKAVLLTTGAQTSGFFQDAKNLYWGTSVSGGQLLRMAK